jgi:hypothetical protein
MMLTGRGTVRYGLMATFFLMNPGMSRQQEFYQRTEECLKGVVSDCARSDGLLLLVCWLGVSGYRR